MLDIVKQKIIVIVEAIFIYTLSYNKFRHKNSPKIRKMTHENEFQEPTPKKDVLKISCDSWKIKMTILVDGLPWITVKKYYNLFGRSTIDQKGAQCQSLYISYSPKATVIFQVKYLLSTPNRVAKIGSSMTDTYVKS